MERSMNKDVLLLVNIELIESFNGNDEYLK